MTMTTSLKWDLRMLMHAAVVSLNSKDPSTKVGAVIADQQNRVISQGFNGFPQGIDDDARLSDRATKYKMVLHAEENAMIFARQYLKDCTIYTFPMMPCATCTSKLIQSGISRVVAPLIWPARWKEDIEIAKALFAEAGVPLHFYSANRIRMELHSLELDLATLRCSVIPTLQVQEQSSNA